MGFEIREMKIDDLPGVFHLGEKLFTSEKHPNLYRTWDEFEVTGLFQADPELCLVADDDGAVGGFLMGTTVEKARSAWNYGYIVWLGIAKRYQRSGLGKRLYDAFKKTMIERGMRILIVDTQADNKSAISFFRQQGFAQATEHVYLSLNLESEHRQGGTPGSKGNSVAL
jgi:ribosomal protein S18 acetylase RimI-like enzyme